MFLIINSFPKMQMPLFVLIDTYYHSSLNYKTVGFFTIFLIEFTIRRAVKLQDFEDVFASDSSQSDDTDENEADESSDYDTDDNLPLSELKKSL